MMKRTRSRRFVAVIAAGGLSVPWVNAVQLGNPVLAATCDPVPFLDKDASATVGEITVTASVNKARNPMFEDKYWHLPGDPLDPNLDTTWTFSPGISRIVLKTSNHADGDGEGGGGLKEVYAFTPNVGLPFNITDEDGTFEFSFASPVTSIAVTFSPTTGNYGSYLNVFIPSTAGACDPSDPPPTDPPTMDPPAMDPPTGLFPDDYFAQLFTRQSELPELR